MTDSNHDGATLHHREIRYDLDKIDNLGFIEHDGLFIIADRINGELVVKRERLSIDEIQDELEAMK
jgi:repressor of nif and glnA expression